MNSEDQAPDLDDLEQEAEAFRKSERFQQFLDDRSRSQCRVPLEKIEEEIEGEIAEQS